MKPAPLDHEGRIAALRLTRTPGVGPVAFAALLKHNGDPVRALAALPERAARAGRRRLDIPSRDRAEQELDAVEAIGGRLLVCCEPAFPDRLRALDPPPPVISVLGGTELFTRPAIGVVGARNASAAGKKMARDLASGLGEAGYVVVSGLAAGIDGEAHRASLDTGTIAVLAGGVDHVYPPQHDGLYRALTEKGAIVSENPIGATARAQDFPRRNRLISGLSLGVLVVEAEIRSGSLITARNALEQNREVFAVPGSPLDPRARGTNRLIRDGALLVETAKDIIDALERPMLRFGAEAPPPLNYQAEGWEDAPPKDALDRMRDALSFTPTPIAALAEAAGLPAPLAASALVELELAGEAQTFFGGHAARTPQD